MLPGSELIVGAKVDFQFGPVILLGIGGVGGSNSNAVIMASEVGVIDVDPARVVRKGRLEPGKMFLVDTSEGPAALVDSDFGRVLDKGLMGVRREIEAAATIFDVEGVYETRRTDQIDAINADSSLTAQEKLDLIAAVNDQIVYRYAQPIRASGLPSREVDSEAPRGVDTEAPRHPDAVRAEEPVEEPVHSEVSAVDTGQSGLRQDPAYGTLLDSSTDLFCSTGPDTNVCAIRVKGKMLSQVETFAGITYRF